MKLYTRRELLKMFGISKPTLLKWEKEGRIEIIRINGCVRVTEESLQAFLEKHKVNSKN